MNIEKQIKNLFSYDSSTIDADKFLDRLHATREKKIRNQQRFSYGISSLVVVLLVGILAITQLNNNAFDIQYTQSFLDVGISEEMLDEYYNDLAVYLVEESDDIWATMEFFYDANYQPMKEILETKI